MTRPRGGRVHGKLVVALKSDRRDCQVRTGSHGVAERSEFTRAPRCRSVLPVRLNRCEMSFSLVEGAFNAGKGEQGAHE